MQPDTNDYIAMNASAAPILRRAVWSAQAPFRCYQRRWARVHDVRLISIDVQDKYKTKLQEKARKHGFDSVDALKEAHAAKIKELRKQAMVPGANAPLNTQTFPTRDRADSGVPFQAPPPPQPQTTIPGVPKASDGIKTLNSFIDVEKIRELPQKEIETIWRLRHVKDAQSLCAVMQTDTYKRMIERAEKHPQFVLPVPREGQGAEIHFLQWTFLSKTTATVLFTHLAEFKLRGEFAQPHTTITYHLDLAERNGLVLMEGRVTENRGLTVEDGKWLLMCLQKFYGFEAHTEAAKENAMRRGKLMDQFSQGDARFQVEELLEEAERVP